MTLQDIHSLVDVENGTGSREIFVDHDIYREELKQVFGRAWLFIGHESQVPNPDDFFVSRMGEESVILTRDRQGELHVLLNTCRHRGMKVCRYDEGNTRLFTCPYHAWSYSTDGELVSKPGELVGVPGFKTHYHGQLDKQEWGLIHVAQMRNYRGTIWATWDQNAPPLEDYLGSFSLWLDSALNHRDGREGGSVVLVGVQKWRTKCNWKFPATNFVGDAAHGVSHKSVNMVGISPSASGRRDERPKDHYAFGWPDLGHGGLGFTPRLEEDWVQGDVFTKYPEVSKYFGEVYATRKKNLEGKTHYQGKGTIFPNMSFHEEQPRTIIVSHPNGPEETEFWRFYLVDEDAPDHVKDTLRHYYMTYSGPGGMTEQDDLENWAYATEASKGAISRQFPYNYQQGLGWSEPFDEYPGAVWCGNLVTEQNQLVWLKRWSEFMQGWEWEYLMHERVHPDARAFPLKVGDK
ncbi:aromatic ring-hydroxylating oxygenase subunit alpha [Ornithinimicrobium murale]|uniref:aromatic ring-hydroxylating oxygenase subunit alpha n=1 Tax=Ornithinimicrobium murale TaxID=1050153 RepID=UPI000E0DAFF2|nr:Rieske 2Fe-2S domain-containing protein [Ornithinimicrobium murale]